MDASHLPAAGRGRSAHQLRVTFVGTHPEVLQRYTQVLKSAGHKAEFVLDLRVLQERLQSEPADLVVVQHGIVDEERERIVAAIRRADPRIPIVILYFNTPGKLSTVRWVPVPETPVEMLAIALREVRKSSEAASAARERQAGRRKRSK